MAVEPVLFPDLVGSEFVRSDEVAHVAEQVLDRHGRPGPAVVGQLRSLRTALLDDDVRVEYLLNLKPFDPLKEDVTHDAIAKVVKAPALWHDVTGIDAVVWVRGYFWNAFDERARAGVLMHELLHIEVEPDDKGGTKVALQHHDVEEFIAAVRYYGAFVPSREALAKAYGLWQQDGGQPAGPQVVEVGVKVTDEGGVPTITVRDPKHR